MNRPTLYYSPVVNSGRRIFSNACAIDSTFESCIAMDVIISPKGRFCADVGIVIAQPSK